MTLCDGMVERCIALVVGGIQRTLVLKQEEDHRRGARGGSAVDGVLATAVADPSRCRWFALDE